MKKLLFTSTFSALAFLAHAQQISSQVVANTGGVLSQGNSQMSYTMGEPITEPQSSSNILLTQGFQQPQLQVTLFDEFGINTANIDIFPNPTQDNVNITFQNDETLSINMTLYDETGRVIHSQGITISPYEKMKYDLSDFVPGVYFMQLVLDDGKTNKTYRIIKQ